MYIIHLESESKEDSGQVNEQFEYCKVCQRTAITQKDATDMGLHTNDFPMDRISGLTTLKNCITLQGALAN